MDIRVKNWTLYVPDSMIMNYVSIGYRRGYITWTPYFETIRDLMLAGF